MSVIWSSMYAGMFCLLTHARTSALVVGSCVAVSVSLRPAP